MFDNFDNVFDSAKSAKNGIVKELTDYQEKGVGIIDGVEAFSNGVFDTLNDVIDEYGDPFGIVDSYVAAPLGVAQGIVDNAIGVGQQLLGAGFRHNPYQIAAKKYLKKLVETPFQQGWQWMMVVDHFDQDFEIYVKDISVGLGSVDSDVVNIGSGSIAGPKSSSSGEVTLTVRDRMDKVVDRWYSKMLGRVRNKDGTVNLPISYVFNMQLLSVSENGEKTPWRNFKVYAAKSEVNLSYEQNGEYITYSLTFQKAATFGHKLL